MTEAIQPELAQKTPTGCIHVCAMDAEGWCVGCHRHESTICRWPGGLGGSVF